jgi:predicted PurR-regulated permease PerM
VAEPIVSRARVPTAKDSTAHRNKFTAEVRSLIASPRISPRMPKTHTRINQTPISEVKFVRRVLIVAGISALAALLWMLSDILLLVFASVLFAVMLRTVASFFSVHTGLRERTSLLIAGLLILGLVAAAILLFGTQLRSQLDLIISQLQFVQQTVVGYFDTPSMKSLLGGTSLEGLFARVLSWSTAAVASAVSLILAIVAGVYMAIDPNVYRDGLIKLFSLSWRPQVRATLDDAGAALRLWLAAQFAAMVIVGVLICIGALLLGIPSPLALGLICGLTEFVPLIGPIIGAVPVLLVAAAQGWEMALWALGLVAVIQQLESNLIMPLLSGRAVKLPPAVGLFAVVAMGVVFGPLALMLAYPLAVVCYVAVLRLYVHEALGEPDNSRQLIKRAASK